MRSSTQAVLAAADVTVEIAPPTPKLLRTLIRRVTGGVARGVTEEMAALDVKVIVNAVRSHLTAGATVARLRAAVDRRGEWAVQVDRCARADRAAIDRARKEVGGSDPCRP